MQDNQVNQPLLWYSNSQYVPLIFAASDADKGENGKVSYGWAPGERISIGFHKKNNSLDSISWNRQLTGCK